MKILLIEDTETHAQLARHALMLFDPSITVHHVDNAEDALEAVARDEYDVVLADYYLPGMSGLHFLITIRERGMDVPVVMITSQGQIKVAVECLRSGANDYVAKDEGYVDLLPQALMAVHARHRAEKENEELQRQIHRKKEEVESTNKKLMQYQREIIHAEKMSALVTLVRGICHELNNPLTGILGYAQLMQEVCKAGEGLEDLKEIEVCAQRCREIIAKLARFCRQEKIATSMVDVNEVLEDSVSFVQYYANRHKVKITTDLQPGLPKTLASVHDLRQAFLAVCLNGIQAMAKGGTLVVKSSLRGELLYLSVTDSGVGIAEENLEQIFNPFFTTREVGEGSGMGLAITYGIIRDHGGEILVDSKVGEGSTFHLVFPVRRAAAVETSPAPAEAPLAG
ncbi:MAG: response regulator [Armatimonadetes bacterium]|nr:response regulator [Armatimonadota bacterium]